MFDPRTGDQLELDLFPQEPWGGRSPRGLTKGRSRLFLRPEPQGHEVMIERDPLQVEIWPIDLPTLREKPPQRFGGAPSLLPLKKPKASRRGSY